MTTPNPLDGILLPFSVPFEPVLDAYSMTIPEAFRTGTSVQTISIPAGVSIIRVTWDGTEGIRYRIDRAGHTGPWVRIIEPSTSRISRSSAPVEVAMTAPGTLAIQSLTAVSEETITAQCRAGVTVIPMSGPII